VNKRDIKKVKIGTWVTCVKDLRVNHYDENIGSFRLFKKGHDYKIEAIGKGVDSGKYRIIGEHHNDFGKSFWHGWGSHKLDNFELKR